MPAATRFLQRAVERFPSRAPPLGDQLADAHLAGLDPLAQRPHSLDDFRVRQFGRRLADRDQQRRGNPVPGNRDFFPPRHPVQQVRQVRLGFKGPYGCHQPLQYN